MEPIFWLVLLVALLVFEIITLGLSTIWFAGGALVAFIAALIGINPWAQLVLFFAVSFILLFFTRPVASRFINSNVTKTNAEGLIGKTARVTQEIDNVNCTGQAVVDGQEWTARAPSDDVIIPVGIMVEVVRIVGVKLIVKERQ